MSVAEQSSVTTATPAPREGARHGVIDRMAFWLFLAMVMLCPLPDGSVDLAWLAIWTGVAAVVVLFMNYRDLPRAAGLLIGGLFMVIGAYALVAYLQSTSPGPLPLPIWSETSALLGVEVPPLSSSVRDAPLIFFGRPLLAALVLMAGIVFGSDRRRASQVSWVVVGAACIFGAIGAIALLFSLRALRPFDQGGSLTAFFINKNTTATYLGSAFLIAATLVMVPVRAKLQERATLSSIFSSPASRQIMLLSAAALFLLVLVPLTKSRGGLILTLLIALAAFASSLRGAMRNWMVIGVSVLGVFALVYAVSGEAWRARQATVGFDSLGRTDAYLAELTAIMEHPLLGLGFGSFAETFPRYRPPELGIIGLFDIGHSTPLELAYEGGLPLAFTVAAFVAVCALVLARGLIRRPNDPFILSGLLVGLLGILHSSFDFSLQIPGYLIIYLAVVGIALGRALLPVDVAVRRRVKVVTDPAASELAAAFRNPPATSPAGGPAAAGKGDAA